ncbi:inner membrane CreD family protein [Roseimicrobium sp. ORNL1]|uniref:inner membrane CreD family protein n=1 Tax=Roseimicrobium sp. ORNL1 TaxID=2711231 RepID=UPI0013E12D4B|nr:inner membrane CreD family protein [Roseimicrobium sp. ORNL1]QIF05612.1 cell envelope integrity protein CreD [Roseimicrobium sp. ORNL1]
MTSSRLFSILAITGAATFAWFVLGATLHQRARASASRMGSEVRQVWGPGLAQPHLVLLGDSVSGSGQAEVMLPASSKVDARLKYEPKKRGLLWHRTYDVEFSARYEITNTAASARNVRVQLSLPTKDTSYDNFAFQLGEGKTTDVAPHNGMVETVTLIPAGTTVPLTVRYNARGLDRWSYTFPQGTRVKNFSLTMVTDFADVSYPVGATSPSKEEPVTKGEGMDLAWNYTDTIDARDIAVDMPKLLNAGPVIARITFFAPVSLVLFFGVLVVTSMLRGINLHPMTYAFLAAGFFTFHLLLAYLGDQMPLHVAFVIAALISLVMVSGYLHAVAGKSISIIAVTAQFAYMVLFSYSFFFDGFTGLTLTITAVATLALLMIATAKVNWEEVFRYGRETLLGGSKPKNGPMPAPVST